MIVKVLVAAALVAAPCPVAPSIPIMDSAIPKVVCPVYAGPILLGWSMGSAVRIGPRLLLSVRHVTSVGNCQINGKAIKVDYESKSKDFAIVSTEDDGGTVRINCEGFVRGRKYEAWGHARGLDELTEVDLEGTGVTQSGFGVLKGIFTVIPGQSGGAVLDKETHALVGMVNAYDPAAGISYSIQLKDTSICGAKA